MKNIMFPKKNVFKFIDILNEIGMMFCGKELSFEIENKKATIY